MLKNLLLCLLLLNSLRVIAGCKVNKIYFDKMNGWHSDIIVKTSDIPYLKEFYNSEFIAISFGDEEFWRSGDFFSNPVMDQISTASSALLTPSDAIMSVRPVTMNSKQVAQYLDEEIILPEQDYKRILKKIKSSFTFDGGKPIYVDSLHNTDLYRSELKYSALRTCNSWVANTLSESELINITALMPTSIKRTLKNQRVKQKNECTSHKRLTTPMVLKNMNIDWSRIN